MKTETIALNAAIVSAATAVGGKEGAGAFLVERVQAESAYPRVTRGQIGRAIDMGVKDASNMGAAMVPAIGIIVP